MKFRAQWNLVISIISKAKSSFVSNILTESSANPRTFWKTLNTIILHRNPSNSGNQTLQSLQMHPPMTTHSLTFQIQNLTHSRQGRRRLSSTIFIFMAQTPPGATTIFKPPSFASGATCATRYKDKRHFASALNIYHLILHVQLLQIHLSPANLTTEVTDSGISQANLNKLQRIQNSLARVTTNISKFQHITPTLKKLPWLVYGLFRFYWNA